MLESRFQQETIRQIRKELLPGCIVLKNDANYLQGVPDFLILYGDKWATLEFKKSSRERTQPNQEYYVELMNGWAFSAFIYPENKEAVLYGLQQSLNPGGLPRLSKS